MQTTKSVILFYLKRDANGFMSNLYECKIVVDGVEYNSSEHLFQSLKAKKESVREWIRRAPSGYFAWVGGHYLREEDKVPGWDKVAAMRKALREKFTQNPELAAKLLATGDAELHEDSPKDFFWGWRDTGHDMLGKLLMEVRDELRNRK